MIDLFVSMFESARAKWPAMSDEASEQNLKQQKKGTEFFSAVLTINIPGRFVVLVPFGFS